MKVVRLNFKKTSDLIDSSSYGHVDLTDHVNLNNIEKYIIPIISQNEGWDTANVTLEGFKNNPQQFQEELDATLFSNVHVALDGEGNPLGLIEYLEESIDKPLSITRMKNLVEMIEDRNNWNKLIELKVVSEDVVNKLLPSLKNYLLGKKLYSEIGVVVRADLQGKKSGATEYLYKLLQNGLIFGWTNNPVIVAIYRKNFKKVIYFPLLSESITDIDGLAAIAVLYADLQTYDKERWRNLKFGALNSPYFVTSRGGKYLDIAKNFVANGKISQEDEERIKYFLGMNAVQGAIFTFN